MSYILFGGLFDPPHLGHLNIALAAQSQIQSGRFIWLPSATPPHRGSAKLSAIDRYEMLKWWLGPIATFEVSDIELASQHSSYAFHTIKIFKDKYFEERSYFLIGSDEADKFTTWYKWEEILAMTTLLVAARDIDYELPKEIKAFSILINNEVNTISSTKLRAMISSGEDVSSHISPELQAYIKERSFYEF